MNYCSHPRVLQWFTYSSFLILSPSAWSKQQDIDHVGHVLAYLKYSCFGLGKGWSVNSTSMRRRRSTHLHNHCLCVFISSEPTERPTTAGWGKVDPVFSHLFFFTYSRSRWAVFTWCRTFNVEILTILSSPSCCWCYILPDANLELFPCCVRVCMWTIWLYWCL